MAYARFTDNAAVITVFNNDVKPAEVGFDISMLKQIPADAVLVDALGKAGEIRNQQGRISLKMPARAAAILTVKG